jgi:hypothetical protein
MQSEKDPKRTGRVTLKTVADHVGLTPGTVSAVLNNSRAADRIPQTTRDRIVAAARELHYQPNPVARALRAGKAFAPQADGSKSGTRGAVVLLRPHQFDRAISAIEQAGLRVHDDFSVLDLAEVRTAWDYTVLETATDPPYDVAAKPS